MASDSQSVPNTRNADGLGGLPDEILAEIFSMGELAIRTDPDATCGLQVFTSMQVCRQWRSVAMSTPVLWSSLLIDLQTLEGIYDDDAERNQVFRAFTELCLTRSAGYPLDMSITYLPSIQDFPWLITTSQRWKSLEVDALELHTMATCPSFTGLPTLRTLKLHSVFGNCPDRGPDLKLPQLTSLELPSGSTCLRRFNISISTLTHVKIQLLYSRELPSLAEHLSTIPNLTHLHLSTSRPYTCEIMRTPFNLPDNTIFRLPKLQRFSLESTPAGAWEILYHCHLPSLVHLSVRECVGRNTQSPDTAFRGFLNSFPGGLQSFSGQYVDSGRFKAVALQLRPATVAFGPVFFGPDNDVNSLVRSVVAEVANLARIERFSLFVVNPSPAFTGLFIESIRDFDTSEDLRSPCSSSHIRKHIDLYLGYREPGPAGTHRGVPNVLDGPSPTSRFRISVRCFSMKSDLKLDDFV